MLYWKRWLYHFQLAGLEEKSDWKEESFRGGKQLSLFPFSPPLARTGLQHIRGRNQFIYRRETLSTGSKHGWARSTTSWPHACVACNNL
jgi:hypothetical protein